MAGRSLHPDEAQLWQRVMATVRPLRPIAVPSTAPKPAAAPSKQDATRSMASPAVVKARPSPPRPVPAKPLPGTTLDGGWDKRLTRGVVQPDTSIDLHGHTLASAHAMLDAGLGRAIARGDRVLLLVTGKPPRAESERPHARGAIRAAVSDWLAISRHSGAIAAVRGAHPRHGGAGALYIILRRNR